MSGPLAPRGPAPILSTDEAVWPRALSKAPTPPPRGIAPRRAPLTGRFARLEPLDPAAHADALAGEAVGDAERDAIFAFLPYGPFADRAAFDAYLRRYAGDLSAVFYAIIDQRRGQPAGVASFLEIDAANGAIEIGHIWFGASIRRSAVGSEALILMMIDAMETFGARRLQWKCDAFNDASRAAARRLGFRFEGVLHHHRVVKGRSRDTAYYSILPAEWPARRTAFDRWLAPENIGADGKARMSLSALTAAADQR